jgi:hypothetical protein
MAEKTNKNRGLTRALLTHMEQQGAGVNIHLGDQLVSTLKREVPDVNKPAISGAFNYLVKQGLVVPGPVRGSWQLVQGEGQESPDTVVIDQLLDAMAKAEPILRKWRRIQEALRSV